MTKALVTGATGFIGSHLVQSLLARREEVTCLVRNASAAAALEAAGTGTVVGDVTDGASLPAAIAGQDVVYHLAGCLRTLHPRQLFQVNEQGLRNIAQTCARQPTPPVLVTVSSLAAAGPVVVAERPRCEGDPPAPVSDYGRSKLAGEEAARQLAAAVPITIVRPPIVFGEADPAMLTVFRMIARFGFHVAPGLVPHRFSVIHADDLVNLMILAAQRGRRLQPAGPEDGPAEDCRGQGIYFAACEENPTYAELGRMIGVAVGRPHTFVLPTANPVVWTIAVASEAMAYLRRQPANFNLDKAREATAGAWLCSPRAAMDELQFSVAAPLSQRLHQTAHWYRQQGLL
ncbi:MAG: NAD-dependent epimerase/dehydratase family protein [Thermoguttaceae bacterium]